MRNNAFSILLLLGLFFHSHQVMAEEFPQPVLKPVKKPPAKPYESLGDAGKFWIEVSPTLGISELKDSNKKSYLRFIRVPHMMSVDLFMLEDADGNIILERKTWVRGEPKYKSSNANPIIFRRTLSLTEYLKTIEWLESEKFWSQKSVQNNNNVDDGTIYLIESKTDAHPYQVVSANNIKAFESLFKTLEEIAKQPAK